jgi:folylpolyglutamate synthase
MSLTSMDISRAVSNDPTRLLSEERKTNHTLFLDLTAKAIDPNDLSTLATQHALSAAWSELVPTFSRERVHVVPSIQHAVNIVRETGKAKHEDVQVLVAGSLHLVGGTMEVAGLAERALSVA